MNPLRTKYFVILIEEKTINNRIIVISIFFIVCLLFTNQLFVFAACNFCNCKDSSSYILFLSFSLIRGLVTPIESLLSLNFFISLSNLVL